MINTLQHSVKREQQDEALCFVPYDHSTIAANAATAAVSVKDDTAPLTAGAAVGRSVEQPLYVTFHRLSAGSVAHMPRLRVVEVARPEQSRVENPMNVTELESHMNCPLKKSAPKSVRHSLVTTVSDSVARPRHISLS